MNILGIVTKHPDRLECQITAADDYSRVPTIYVGDYQIHVHFVLAKLKMTIDIGK